MESKEPIMEFPSGSRCHGEYLAAEGGRRLFMAIHFLFDEQIGEGW